MQTGSETIYILLSRDKEATDLFNELLDVIGYPVNKDAAEKYPRLLELRQGLRKELFD